MSFGGWVDEKEGPPTTVAAGLARQSSVYSLTLDEFQNTLGGLGKDFGSMNMDEFLRSVWMAEETQGMAGSAAIGGGGGPMEPSGVGGSGGGGGGGGDGGGGGGLQRQGSLTLPRTLSQKTVDEVWRELSTAEVGGPPPPAVGLPRRQQTLGEMTLEEFLVRAGVVREDANAAAAATQFDQRMYQPPPPMPQQQLFPKQTAAGGPVFGIGEVVGNGGLMQGGGLGMVGLGGGAVTVAAGGGVGSSPVNQISNGDLSSLSPVPYVFNGAMRGRKGTGQVEKVVERRQRRMIKNRESAARSRARKQAHTMELEAEVAKLKEENLELQKKQAEIMEMQKNQALEMITQQFTSKRRCLRRTQTGPW
ncbi:ABSCISIC ACID-INSENSITIVE 5-like protein 7 [Acorus calamus]|uniref:ABSCISIC ACID-INSENSITIVE 5-like protein 7 n=1 Tax=Acorus calamus TaxID=4465 RepID=A0AAV9EQJ8_ACOCL|nr:ABSCISIC ACID-INSENSITIVE 5-like protein 7 [Acorus calamus]